MMLVLKQIIRYRYRYFLEIFEKAKLIASVSDPHKFLCGPESKNFHMDGPDPDADPDPRW